MKELLNLVPRNARLLAAAIVSLLSLTLAAKAQVIEGSELANAADFGTLGQLNVNVTVENSLPIRPEACVPTATIDGLTYLYNFNKKNLPNLFTTPPDTYPQLNALAKAMGTFNNPVKPTNYYGYFNKAGMPVLITANAPATKEQIAAFDKTNMAMPIVKMMEKTVNTIGGTYVNSAYNGLKMYLSKPAPDVFVSGQQYANAVPPNWYATTGTPPKTIPIQPSVAPIRPTALYLANALKANDGVEVTLQWGFYYTKDGKPYGNFQPTGGGHELTLDSITLNTSTKTGTIGYLDPSGSPGPLGSATPFTSSLYLVKDITSKDDYYLYFQDLAAVPDNNFGGVGPGGGEDPYGRITSDMVEYIRKGAGGGAPAPIPDGASTLLILGASITGLAAFRRLARTG
jgi:hypothetical protein